MKWALFSVGYKILMRTPTPLWRNAGDFHLSSGVRGTLTYASIIISGTYITTANLARERQGG
jgi:hypothetical protein